MKDGQILDVPGRPVVIHTPGHTPGEVSFHFPKQKVLITGDSLVTLDLFSGLNVFPTTTPYALNDNLTEARKSIERFKGLGEILVLPGHGKPWKGDIEQVIFQVQHLVIGNQTGY
jgi:glyoxylase-like metal-dependent hydrolase (beta-lactamase superfamily II)